jgi:transcription elongation factor GreA
MQKYLTQEGLEKLKKELDYLKTVKRTEIAERLKHAIAFGDLTENAAYHEAKEAQGFLEGRILDLEEEIRNSVIISDEKKKDSVNIGSTITLEKNGEKLKFKIVGVQEADPTGGKISNESPLGRAILDRKKGEVVEVETPLGRTKYKILKIE